MKILHIGPVCILQNKNCSFDFDVYPGLGIDGPTRSILGLAQGLAESGTEVGVLSTRALTLHEKWPDRGIKLLTPYPGHKYSIFVNTEKWIDRILTEFGKPDLVHFHDFYEYFSCTMAAAMKKRGWKYIISPRGSLNSYALRCAAWKKKIANPLFFRRYLRGAEAVHVLTKSEEGQCKFFDPLLKTFVLPNGIFKKTLSFGNKHIKLSNGKLTLGYIGQLFVEIKGLDLLFDAIVRFQRLGMAENVRFQFVGPANNLVDRQRIGNFLQSTPYPEWVSFLGPKYGREKWTAFNDFDVFVLPSRTEGMPVVALEAMAIGKPCLLSEGTNLAHLINEINGGWGCATDVSSILGRLIEIAKTPRDRLSALGQSAKDYVSQHLTWDKLSGQYIEMYEGVLRR